MEFLPWIITGIALGVACTVLYLKRATDEEVNQEEPQPLTQQDIQPFFDNLNAQVSQVQGGLQANTQTTTQLVTEMIEESRSFNQIMTNPVDAGDIGEMSLDIFLEQSGLSDEHYSTQQTYILEGGEILRPDAEITLPGNGKVIIDAKTPATAWMESIREENPEQKQVLLQENANNLKNMARSLSTRGYHLIEEFVIPDVIVMYIPFDVIYYEFRKVAGNDFLSEANRGFLNNQGARGVPIIFAPPSLIGGFLRMLKFLWRERNTYEDNTELVTNIINFANNLKFLARHLVEGGAFHVKAGNSLRKAFSRIEGVAEDINDLNNLVETEDLVNELNNDFMNVPPGMEDIDEERILEWIRRNPNFWPQIRNENGEEPDT